MIGGHFSITERRVTIREKGEIRHWTKPSPAETNVYEDPKSCSASRNESGGLLASNDGEVCRAAATGNLAIIFVVPPATMKIKAW